MLRTRTIWLLTALCLPLPLAAETLTFQLDPAATKVELSFTATLHSVEGLLHVKSGTLLLDPEAGTAQGRIVIDATSAETGNSQRDEKMHDKILESRLFPVIIFDVDRISGALHRAGRSDVLLHGMIEMHGVRRPADLPATILVEGDKIRATGHLTIPYLEWGLRDPSFFLLRVAKEVQVDIHAAGRLEEGDQTAQKTTMP
ncbi:MAG TPA: YceI family protein [Thermoanaerobaculia bacterium]|nr:YceI family protein [Thermoanaerobaculia bacterium]